MGQTAAAFPGSNPSQLWVEPSNNKAPAQGGGDEVTHSINPMATVVNLWVQARFPRVKDGPKTGNHIDVISLPNLGRSALATACLPWLDLVHGRQDQISSAVDPML